MLASILKTEDYALALAPGFFCYYAEMGVLHALEDSLCLRPTHVSGSSAGALVGAFLAAGMSPGDMREPVFNIKRKDIWDLGGFGGLLKGQLAQALLEKLLPVKTFDHCKFPLGVTAWDLVRFRTKHIQQGDIATAIRASACFPGLFAPVMIDGAAYIDGGIFDSCGLFALPGVPPSNLIVNVICGRGFLSSSKPPEKYSNARLLTLVLENVPAVSPFTMEERGPDAYRCAYAATKRALHDAHIQQPNAYHWIAFLDGAVGIVASMPTSTEDTDEHDSIGSSSYPFCKSPRQLISAVTDEPAVKKIKCTTEKTSTDTSPLLSKRPSRRSSKTNTKETGMKLRKRTLNAPP